MTRHDGSGESAPTIEAVLAGVSAADRETRIDVLRRLRDTGPPEDLASELAARLVDLIERKPDPEVRKAAALGLQLVGDHDPAALQRVAGSVVERTRAETDSLVRVYLLQIVADVAAVDPEAVVPLVPTMADCLDEPLLLARQKALDILVPLAAHDPASLESVLPAVTASAGRPLFETHSDPSGTSVSGGEGELGPTGIDSGGETLAARRERVAETAVSVVEAICAEEPSRLTPLVSDLAAVVQVNPTVPRSSRLVAILANIARSNPAAVAPARDALITFVDAVDDEGALGAGVLALGLLADATPEETGPVLEPLVPTLTAMVREGDGEVCSPACTLLSFVAEYRPSAVGVAVPILEDALASADDPTVRAAAADALGYAHDSGQTVARLRSATRDESPMVRKVAAEALERHGIEPDST